MPISKELISNFKFLDNNEVIIGDKLANKLLEIIQNENRVAHSISVGNLAYHIAT